MSQLQWDQVGERAYEIGTDRGVLYPPNAAGVAWNGLVSVTERTVGDEPVAYYYDGVRYLVATSNTDYEATLEAYTYPEEFEECEGTIEVVDGFSATNQPPKSFGLCYRTQVGDDLSPSAQHYKLHLVYNALAIPSERPFKTMSDSMDPSLFSWVIWTVPEFLENVKPTAHFSIDSRRLEPPKLQALEDILYGTVGEDPRLPLPSEVGGLLV